MSRGPGPTAARHYGSGRGRHSGDVSEMLISDAEERVCLFCWKEEEAREKAALLRAAGFAVEWEGIPGPEAIRRLAARPPDAIVIGLDRLPSQGRDIALLLRMGRATRTIPLVMAGGAPDKVMAIRSVIPDAPYVDWDHVIAAVRGAIDSPPTDPVVPDSVFAGYAGVPLCRKLGIKEGSVVALIGAPAGIREIIGPLPPGAEIRQGPGGPCSLTIWFARSRGDLAAGIATACSQAAYGPIWIAWPKKASGQATDITQQAVRDAGLAAGLVDYKVCSIDPTWSGLLFRRRARQS